MPNDNFSSLCFQAHDSFISRRIGDEIILVPIRQQGAELHNIIRLNEVAAFIWERLNGTSSTEELTAAIVEHYQVQEEQASADLEALLRQLLEINAIEGT